MSILLVRKGWADISRNYLQSPYYFMCCSLVDADLNRPGQLGAGQLGEDPDVASQPALTGVLVSSLHRLKDTNNLGESLLRGLVLQLCLP